MPKVKITKIPKGACGNLFTAERSDFEHSGVIHSGWELAWKERQPKRE